MEQKRKEREAVAAIIKDGWAVGYDYDNVKGAEPPGPGWLRFLLGENFFCEVDSVSCTPTTTFSAEGLENLKALPQLHKLYLGRSKITDAELEHLKELSQLERLLGSNKDHGRRA